MSITVPMKKFMVSPHPFFVSSSSSPPPPPKKKKNKQKPAIENELHWIKS